MTLRDKPLEELDKLLFETEILIETGSDEERFLGAFQTIAGISKYLASKYPTLNRRPRVCSTSSRSRGAPSGRPPTRQSSPGPRGNVAGQGAADRRCAVRADLRRRAQDRPGAS